MADLSRRRFLHGTGATALAVGTAPLLAANSPAWQPHNEVRVAVVGLNGRGRNHVTELRRQKGVNVAALVDVDANVLAREAKKFTDQNESVDTYLDLRRVLDRKDIDAISVATPNHWHALQAIWACQAGKDVYLEKPVSHNVWEGGQIVKAARKYGRIVQTGTQSRSSHGLQQAIDYLQAGELGKIQLARGLCYKPRQSIGKVKQATSVPKHIDYDLWCGPAPNGPLLRKHLHYDWHWVSDTGNGDVGNQGIHQMDIARWALGQDQLPVHTRSIGGRVGYDDDGNTPNTQIVFHEFADGPPLLFEVRGLPRSKAAQQNWRKQMDDYRGARIGVILHCENGYLRIPSYSKAIAFDHDGNERKRFQGASNHFANFLDAVRSRKHEDLRADIREGHLSSAMCHMGNVSHQLGKHANKQQIDDYVRDNEHIAEAWQRMHSHLRSNEVDLGTDIVVGPRLTMNPATERFDDDAANAFATRAYREGFVVPENV